MSETATAERYVDAANQVVSAPNGVDYAYRETGGADGVPLVTLQHFRGNLDNWDPALIDALARNRRVISFDNRGVAASSGTTPNTIAQMALDAIDFIDALGLAEVDLLGFSIGSFVAQDIALIRPDLLRRVVLASSAPQGASGMHGWVPDVIGAVGQPEPNPQGYLDVFFAHTSTSREIGQQVAGRIFGRTSNRDEPTTWQTRQAQYDAVCRWGIPNHSLLQRVEAIDLPVFVANGDSDPMILPRYSYLLAGLIPGARIKIYPDAAHGFLFQHHAEFAADVEDFLLGSRVRSTARDRARVTAGTELVGQPWMGGLPTELGPSPGRRRTLIVQQHLGEVVAEARSRLVIGARDRSGSADGNRGGLGQLGNGRGPACDDVATAGRVVFQHPAEEVGEVRYVHRRPVLLSAAEHDQVAGVVSR